jgi:hypothetical protein
MLQRLIVDFRFFIVNEKAILQFVNDYGGEWCKINSCELWHWSGHYELVFLSEIATLFLLTFDVTFCECA